MKSSISFIIVILFFAAMAVTCPSKNAHYKAISEDLVGKNLASKVMQFGVEKIVDVNNYFIFSVGRYKLISDDIVSVGLFGHVFTFTKDNILEEGQRLLDF